MVLRQKLSIAVLAWAFLVAVSGAQSFPAPDSQTARPSSDDSQSSSASSTLFGTVQDPSGAVISQAIVLLRPSANRTPIRTETDPSGGFHFEKIPVGSYTLTIAAPAFKDATIPITFKGKRLPPLRVTLALASQSETVTVGGADSSPQVTTDTSQNQSANTFERAALDRVPVFDQDYITTLSRFLDDNSVSTNGVSLVVNGIEANGPGVTPSAIQEVRINQNPYSALFANPGRARLEITTKPGTPALHGSVNFLYRDAQRFRPPETSRIAPILRRLPHRAAQLRQEDHFSSFLRTRPRRPTGHRQRHRPFRNGPGADSRKCSRSHAPFFR